MATWALFRRLFASEFGRRIFVALLITTLLLAGIGLRQLTWQKTKHVRFQHDIVNGFYWGSETLKEARNLSPAAPDSWTAFFRGYFALYDRVKREVYENDYGLDYPPLRLLVMSIWAKEVRDEFPGVDDGHPKHVKPLLHINLVCELVSAVTLFFLVRLWIRRASGAVEPSFLRRIPREQRALICALTASSVAWLEPSMILDAHGWPQWDVWIVPFYLFAVLAALTNRWFLTGCLLAAGAMFKGQLLFVAPFFILWPLWQKKWARSVRVAAGFALTTALIVSPWLLRNPQAWIFVLLAGGASSAALLGHGMRHVGARVAGIVATVIFLAGVLFGGSFAWLQIGFLYGSEHYPYLFISSCYNLPSLLDRFGWSLKDSLWSHDFGSRYVEVTLQWGLRLLYLTALALCARGAARHFRDRDPRLLIAIAAPWLFMFALLGQMHERYLMWGAIVSAVALGVSVRLSIIHFIISAASATMIVHVMLIDKKLEPTLQTINALNSLRPFASGVVLICVAVCLWNMLSTRIPIFQREKPKLRTAPSLSLEPALEEV
jgi:hypothetical protein